MGLQECDGRGACGITEVRETNERHSRVHQGIDEENASANIGRGGAMEGILQGRRSDVTDGQSRQGKRFGKADRGSVRQ